MLSSPPPFSFSERNAASSPSSPEQPVQPFTVGGVPAGPFSQDPHQRDDTPGRRGGRGVDDHQLTAGARRSTTATARSLCGHWPDLGLVGGSHQSADGRRRLTQIASSIRLLLSLPRLLLPGTKLGFFFFLHPRPEQKGRHRLVHGPFCSTGPGPFKQQDGRQAPDGQGRSTR